MNEILLKNYYPRQPTTMPIEKSVYLYDMQGRVRVVLKLNYPPKHKCHGLNILKILNNIKK